jgi:hypothetical protein
VDHRIWIPHRTAIDWSLVPGHQSTVGTCMMTVYDFWKDDVDLKCRLLWCLSEDSWKKFSVFGFLRTSNSGVIIQVDKMANFVA